MIVPPFRLIAGLLVLGGASLGLLAGNLMASRPQAPAHRGDPRIEAQVEQYREHFALDAERADRVRHELQALQQALRDKRLELQRRHRAEFEALKDETYKRIVRIVDGLEARGRSPNEANQNVTEQGPDPR